MGYVDKHRWSLAWCSWKVYLAQVAIALVLAIVWKRFFRRGPLEYVFAKISGRAENLVTSGSG